MKKRTIGDCTLYCGDCLEVMQLLEKNSVRMIWTDPPYGHKNHDGDFNSRLNDFRQIESKPIENDDMESMRSVVDSMLSLAVSVLSADCCCCCCCGGGPKPTFAWLAERMDSKGLSFFHSVIWDKKNPGLGWRYRRQHEMIMVAHKRGEKLAWSEDIKAVPNIISEPVPKKEYHPNQKPVSLVRRFILCHTKPGDVVLDPFMGSGTTGVACVEQGRKFIGIEINENFFEEACDRIERAYRDEQNKFPEVRETRETQGTLI